MINSLSSSITYLCDLLIYYYAFLINSFSISAYSTSLLIESEIPLTVTISITITIIDNIIPDLLSHSIN